MTTLIGTLEYSVQNIGTKSEGCMAILKCDDGKTYTLYRSGNLPIDDSFFADFHGKKVCIEGNIEESTDNLCVKSITLQL